MSFEKIPDELKTLPQWVCWSLQDRAGKKVKLPINPRSGRLASATDPSTWSTYEQAMRSAVNFHGIGFVFSENDPYFGLDMDGHVDMELIGFMNTYAERSQSGKGAHIIGRGKIGGGKRNASYEAYDRERYFIMTGNVIDDKPIRGELLQHRFELLQIHQRGGWRHITPVKQRMHAHLLHPGRLRLLQHRNQMANMTVHIAIGKQTDEMKLRAMLDHMGNQFLPRRTLEQRAIVDRILDQTRALRKNAPRADRIMPDLSVAHVLIARHTDGGAVGLELGIHRVLLQPVQMRLGRLRDHIARGMLSNAHPVHDGQHHRPLRPRVIRDFVEFHNVLRVCVVKACNNQHSRPNLQAFSS